MSPEECAGRHDAPAISLQDRSNAGADDHVVRDLRELQADSYRWSRAAHGTASVLVWLFGGTLGSRYLRSRNGWDYRADLAGRQRLSALQRHENHGTNPACGLRAHGH